MWIPLVRVFPPDREACIGFTGTEFLEELRPFYLAQLLEVLLVLRLRSWMLLLCT